MASERGYGWERTSFSELLTREVLEFARREGLEPGDRLPSVQALAERFSVAAPTMRESLRRLQAVGLVEIRHGSGIYLRHQTTPLVLPNPHPGQLSWPTIFDLLDARLLIEPRLAELAAQLADPAELSILRRSLDEAGAHLEGEDKLLGRINMGFHRQVARCSGSSVLAQVIESLVDVYEDEQLVVLKLYDNRLHDHQEHLGILEAIASGSPQLARRRMREHLQGVRDVLARRLPAEGEEPEPRVGGPRPQAQSSSAIRTEARAGPSRALPALPEDGDAADPGTRGPDGSPVRALRRGAGPGS